MFLIFAVCKCTNVKSNVFLMYFIAPIYRVQFSQSMQCNRCTGSIYCSVPVAPIDVHVYILQSQRLAGEHRNVLNDLYEAHRNIALRR